MQQIMPRKLLYCASRLKCVEIFCYFAQLLYKMKQTLSYWDSKQILTCFQSCTMKNMIIMRRKYRMLACLFSKEQSSSWDYRQNMLQLQNFKEFSKHILNNLPLEWKSPSKLCLFLLCALFPKVLESGTSALRKTPPVVFHTAIFPS